MSEDKRDFGGGSGGGTNTRDESRAFDGTYSVTANQIEFTSRAALPPALPDPCAVTILASDLTQMNGNVNLRGLGGVRITAGPPPLPETGSNSTQGVEIEVGEIQNVTIKRGLIDGVDQKIEMTPSGITVDGGAMPVTIQSLTQIKLSVCGGLSSIILGPDGITIMGLPLVKIN
ncbi:MAG TPA: hypothetical protein VMT32_18620 [Bryobacteraceae bacterium]|nr:hypothetical protein [Bryobacteraceae bacterium]